MLRKKIGYQPKLIIESKILLSMKDYDGYARLVYLI